MRKYLLILVLFLNWSPPIFSQVKDSLQLELLKLNDKDKPAVLNQLWKEYRNTDLEKATGYANQAYYLFKNDFPWLINGKINNCLVPTWKLLCTEDFY